MSFVVNGEPVKVGGTEDRLLPWDKVREIVGISRTTAWRLQQIGDFPEPVPISANRVGWWESELTAWKSTRTRASDGSRSAVPARTLKVPWAPRLLETARSSRREAQTRQSDLPTSPLDSVATPAMTHRSRRRKRAVAADQIDFGF